MYAEKRCHKASDGLRIKSVNSTLIGCGSGCSIYCTLDQG